VDRLVFGVLFPGFLDEKKSGILPFGQASLELMEAAFSAPAVARALPQVTADLLRQAG